MNVDFGNLQPELFTGSELAEQGMNRAADNADEKSPGWSERAYQHLIAYAKQHREFMTEDMRNEFEPPPNMRAWGAIVVRAKKSNIIKFLRYGQRKNPVAHNSTVTVWTSLIFEQ